MSYQITIVRSEPNPNFVEEMAKFEESRRMNRGMYHPEDRVGMPQEEVRKNVLLVELTDEQWKRVKAEIIKEFE